MTTTTTMMLPSGGIALVGAPNGDIGDRPQPLQAMQVEMTQDIVDELLESLKSGKPPQILFGRTPQLKYGDKTHVLQSSPETHTYELYKSSGTGSDDGLEFAGVINHNLIVQEAADVTAGVDSALATLKSSMAAISEFKEANKTIVGDATPVRTPGHRRFPSTGFKAAHLAPSKAASSLPSMPVSPVHQRPPTSQPSGTHEAVLAALRIPIIHLLARSPATEASLAKTCRASAASVRDLLPKIAKRSTQDADKWQLTDKSFREINPYNFPYSTSEEREQAIEGAIKSFDRLRLTKDDKLWQILLPREERGQGKCLSRSKVKPLEAKPKASTPLHKVSDFTKKKPAAKKVDDKPTEKKADSEKKIKTVKEGSSKISKAVRDRIVPQDKPTVKEVKEDVTKAAAPTPAPISKAESKATSRPGPSTEAPKIKTKKVPTAGGTSSNTNTAPRTKPKMATARESYQDRQHRPVKPIYNTKPKNPSPLSASPPVNASDFEDNHPVHKALAAAASPVKSSYGNSDRSLKRKANDIDSNIHNHSLAVKKPNPDRVVHSRTPSHTNGRPNGSTPSSNTLQKRKPDDSSVTNTPTTAPKSRKVTNISVGLASRYNHNNSHPSPGDSSSSTTSPTIPSLSFRQTVELSQKFQKYYTKYEELYWRLTEATSPPTEAQRNDLLMMHKKLEEMKREIKAGARMQR